MHYVEEGEGEPFLLLHGNPTSSYLWRNIIPHLNGLGRVVVPDLIGMGRSDKPDIAYRFEDHARYLDGFIEALGLKNITLVLHDWGSGLGFHYAARNPDNIKAISFMEAVVNTMEWSEIPKEHKLPFKLFRAPVTGWFMLSVMNVFVNGFLPKAIVRKLGPEEMKAYRAPFRTVAKAVFITVWHRCIGHLFNLAHRPVLKRRRAPSLKILLCNIIMHNVTIVTFHSVTISLLLAVPFGEQRFEQI